MVSSISHLFCMSLTQGLNPVYHFFVRTIHYGRRNFLLFPSEKVASEKVAVADLLGQREKLHFAPTRWRVRVARR